MTFSKITKAAAAIAAAISAVPLRALAASDALNRALEVGDVAGLGGGSPNASAATAVAYYIKQFLGFMGVVVVVLFIYGGVLWMMAGGSEEKVSKARKVLVSAVIGLIIVFGSYAISAFVLGTVLSATDTS